MHEEEGVNEFLRFGVRTGETTARERSTQGLAIRSSYVMMSSVGKLKLKKCRTGFDKRI